MTGLALAAALALVAVVGLHWFAPGREARTEIARRWWLPISGAVAALAAAVWLLWPRRRPEPRPEPRPADPRREGPDPRAVAEATKDEADADAQIALAEQRHDEAVDHPGPGPDPGLAEFLRGSGGVPE